MKLHYGGELYRFSKPRKWNMPTNHSYILISTVSSGFDYIKSKVRRKNLLISHFQDEIIRKCFIFHNRVKTTRANCCQIKTIQSALHREQFVIKV